jgi:hypothetical protein
VNAGGTNVGSGLRVAATCSTSMVPSIRARIARSTRNSSSSLARSRGASSSSAASLARISVRTVPISASAGIAFVRAHSASCGTAERPTARSVRRDGQGPFGSSRAARLKPAGLDDPSCPASHRSGSRPGGRRRSCWPSIGEEIGRLGLVSARTMRATAASACCSPRVRRSASTSVTAESAPASQPSS